MSKKCCGIIYSDNEEVCKICGKSLENAESVQEETVIEDNESVKEEIEETKKTEKTESDVETKTETKTKIKSEAEFVFEDDDDDENKASGGHKAFGIISILLMLAVIAMIGLCVYFLIIAPFYVKDASDTPPVYPELSTVTDAATTGIREPVPYTEVSTTTDAETSAEATEDAFIIDEDSEIATIGDATEPVIEENSDENVEE